MAEPHSPWDGTERRKSPRLRKIIDDLQAGVRDNTAQISALTHQIVHFKEEIDTLKYRAQSASR
jgi:hypothetical protein